MEDSGKQVESFGRSGGIGAWLLAALAVLAAAAVAFRVWAGKRTDSEPAVDVHAMNGELVEREAALAERIRVLDSERAEYARRTIRRDAMEADRTLAELPPDDGADRLAQTRALSRFRIDSESLVAEVSSAVEAASSARAEVVRAASAAKTAEREFSDTVEPELDDWLRKVQAAADELAGWRAQRLAKMENREFATFPAFYAAASDYYREWENGADTASEIRIRLFDDLLPRAESAASNLANRVLDVQRESVRAATASATLRGLPVDSGLFDSARSDALSAYGKDIQGAKDAFAAIERWASSFPDDTRQSILDLRNRSDSLEKAAGAASPPLPYEARETVAEAVRAGRNAVAEESIASFETEWDALHREWSGAEGRIGEGDAAAKRIRNAKRKDEADVIADMIVLETVRNLVDGIAAVKRIGELSAVRTKTETGLSDAGKKIDEANAVRWNAEKDAIRNDLLQLKESWTKPAAPGWIRPAQETAELLRSINGLLEKLDSTPEQQVRSGKASIAKVSKDLEGRVVWTPGARHPNKPHVFATDKENVWDADPGYWFDNPGENSDLVVSWRPGFRHPDHPHVSAGQREGTWVPDPGYKEGRNGDLDPVWTPGARHPTKPHVFATDKENNWDADPGYWFDHPGENSDLVVSWRPGNRHPDHPNISAGQREGTWVPDPGYKERWNGDLDPIWTPGMKHSRWPHVFAGKEARKWDHDPGYEWASSDGSDFSVRWVPGKSHPEHNGIETAQQEGKWLIHPGWAWVNPGTSDLRTRWTPGVRHPDYPHIRASDTNWQWFADDGYEFNVPNSSNLSVHWKPGKRHSRHRGLVAASREGWWETEEGWKFITSGLAQRQESDDIRTKWMAGVRKHGAPHVHASDEEGKWTTDDGYAWASDAADDFSVVWNPNWVSSDGMKRAREREGQFSRKQKCHSCSNGWKTKTERCPGCRGTGKIAFGLPCPKCNGNKRIQTRSICDRCNGAGWYWP